MVSKGIFSSAFFSIAFGVFQSAAGEPSAPTNATDDFAALVKRGDQSRLARDYLKAINAYRDALALRDDTLLEGRIGVMLFEMREFDIAAQHLQRAVEKPSRAVSDVEYANFSRTFKAVQNEVCRINVVIDRRGTRLEVDGKLIQEGKGEFWFFVASGTHNVRVSLEGFEDQAQDINAPKGGEKTLTFNMRLLAKPSLEPEKPALPDPPLPPKIVNPPPVPGDKPIAKTNSGSRGQFVIGGGFAFMLGATPEPALGPQVFGAWRSRSWWEIGLDARVGWMFVKDDRFPGVGFVTWSAGITPCGRLRDRFFGCALLQMEGVANDEGQRSSTMPGLGLRAGVELAVVKSLHLQLWGDALVRPHGFRYTLNELSGSFITGTFGLRAAYFL